MQNEEGGLRMSCNDSSESDVGHVQCTVDVQFKGASEAPSLQGKK